MKKLFSFAFCALLFLSNCAKNTEKSETSEKAETAVQRDDATEALTLDNGQKWKINKEMQPFILKGSDLVNQYLKENKTDYKALAAELSTQNSQLVKSCTMKGKSHDELHKWLHPHLELVEQLGNESNAENAQKTVLKLQESYQTYQQYFN